MITKDKDHKEYLDYLISCLINKEKLNIVLNRNWSRIFNEPGVYVFEKITLSMLRLNFCKRKNEGHFGHQTPHIKKKNRCFKFFRNPGYKTANSKTKFMPSIEEMVSEWMVKKMKLSFIQVNLGRKELEELVIKRYNPKYNSVSKRK